MNRDSVRIDYSEQDTVINLILRLTKYITLNLNVSIKTAELFLSIKFICNVRTYTNIMNILKSCQ